MEKKVKQKAQIALVALEEAKRIESDAQQALLDAQQAMAEAEQSDIATMEEAKQKILEICEESNLFCGLVLTKGDILNILSLAIDSKENIKIPFVLYFKND
jgi:hypothetical protein